MSCTCSTYARLAAPISRRSAGCSTSGRSASTSVSGGRGHDRDADAEALGAALDDVGLQVRDDGLAERHRLEREHAVPAGVQLVDDDVGAGVALARLLVRDALDDVELDGSCAHASITCCVPFFSRFDGACTTSGRALSDGGTGVNSRRSSPVGRRAPRAPSGSRRRSRRSRRRRACRSASSLGRLAADVGAEVVEDALLAAARAAAGTGSTSARASGRSRSGRRRSAARAVRTRRTAAQPLRQRPVAVERPVGLVVERSRARRRRAARRRPSAAAPGRSPTGCPRCSRGSASRAAWNVRHGP